MRKIPNVKIFSTAWRISGRDVFPQHVSERYSHLVASARIANHGADLITAAVEGVNVADRHCFFAGAEPGFREHTLFYAASQRNIVQPKTKHASVHVENLGGF